MNAFATDSFEPLADYRSADCLIFGIGNVGRMDDGLGWAFMDWLAAHDLCPHAEQVRHYQLQLEVADLIRHKQRVLFVDATKAREVQSLQLESVQPRMDPSFTSHAVSIASVLAICKTCFDTTPDVQLLTIKGSDWELGMGLSAFAQRNLDLAKQFFLQGQGYTP